MYNRIVRWKRIKTRFDQRLIGRTSAREWNESTICRTWLAFRFNFLGNEQSEQSVKGNNFYSSSSSPRIHIFNRPLTPLFAVLSSRTDNDVSLFLKCVLSVASRLSSPSSQEKSSYAIPNIHFCASLLRRCRRFASNLFQILH